MITKDISVDGSDYKLTLTDQVLNQVDNLKALYATAAEDPESFEQVISHIDESDLPSGKINCEHISGFMKSSERNRKLY